MSQPASPPPIRQTWILRPREGSGTDKVTRKLVSETQFHDSWLGIFRSHLTVLQRRENVTNLPWGGSQLCCQPRFGQQIPWKADVGMTGCGGCPHARGPSSLFSQSPAHQAGGGEESSILLPAPSPTSSLWHCSASGSPSWGRRQRVAGPRPVSTPTLASQQGARGSL